MKKDYSDVLNKIKIALYILIVLLVANIVLNIVNTNIANNTYASISGSGSGQNNNDNNKEEEYEYDVSKFKAVTYKQLTEDIKSEDYTVVYVGRSTCGYCAKFLPMMKQGQEEFGFTTLYFDITQVIDFAKNSIIDQDAYDGLIATDDFFKENFG